LGPFVNNVEIYSIFPVAAFPGGIAPRAPGRDSPNCGGPPSQAVRIQGACRTRRFAELRGLDGFGGPEGCPWIRPAAGLFLSRAWTNPALRGL